VKKEKYSDDVILEGNMYKKGHLFRSWKKRRFVLNPLRLCYYDGQSLKGTHNLKNNEICNFLEDDSLGFFFTLRSPSGDVLQIAAETEAIRSNWVSEIRALILSYDDNVKAVKLRVDENSINSDTISTKKLGRAILSMRRPVKSNPHAASDVPEKNSGSAASGKITLLSPHADVIVSTPPAAAARTEEVSSVDHAVPAAAASESGGRWNSFLRPGEKILTEGAVIKKNPMGIPLSRQLVLTDIPRLFYIDASTMIFKGEVEWPRDAPVAIEELSKTTIKLSCKGRSYKFTDSVNGARYWIDKIESVVKKV